RAWNPGHPSTGPVGPKRYALVPETGLISGEPVVLVRHFFGHLRKRDSSKAVIELDVTSQRAFCDNGRIPLSPQRAQPRLFAPAIDQDGMRSVSMTLPHEFGHALSLFDEYLEAEEPRKNDPPLFRRRARFVQSAIGRSDPFRPFDNDGCSMMRMDQLP